jgi:hypothetical protein
MTVRDKHESPKQRGDIVSVYTSFPWPALCEEVKKLRIELREGIILDGDFRGVATSLATAQARGRNRWKELVTPAEALDWLRAAGFPGAAVDVTARLVAHLERSSVQKWMEETDLPEPR